jgi:hypothetical protein
MKNQLSFHKMLETQLAQLVTSLPCSKSGGIPGQPEPTQENLSTIATRWGKPSRRMYAPNHVGKLIHQIQDPWDESNPSVEKTSRLRSRDPVASGVKCGPHGGMNNKMNSWTVSWLSLKTKVKLGLRGS